MSTKVLFFIFSILETCCFLFYPVKLLTWFSIRSVEDRNYVICLVIGTQPNKYIVFFNWIFRQIPRAICSCFYFNYYSINFLNISKNVYLILLRYFFQIVDGHSVPTNLFLVVDSYYTTNHKMAEHARGIVKDCTKGKTKKKYQKEC